MENWIVLNKLILIIYVSSILIEQGLNSSKKTPEVIFFLLLFIIINFGKALIENKKYKYMLILASIIQVLLCYLFLESIFIFLLPLNIYEILLDKLKWGYVLGILIATMFFIKEGIVNEYIVISLVTFSAYWFGTRAEKRIQKLSVSCDELKEKNYKLLTDLNNEIEYKNQIIYTSQLEERNKITQEIHDKLGHSISGSLMQLEAANLIMDKDSQQSKKIIQSTIRVLREGMESIRATLKNIKPESQQIGINKIKLLVDEFKSNDEITGGLYYSGNIDKISYLEWKVIYENVKEALTNIRKYSRAKTFKVDIKVLNKFIKVEIKDDGRGCQKIIRGLGISGIEERTLNLNGKAIIDGSDGFSVIILLPINDIEK